MKAIVFAVFVGLFCLIDATKQISPKVQVYSRSPGFYGKPNMLLCHVSDFYPPEITIELLKGDNVLPGGKQTDLAFEENWSYHLTKHVPFTPNSGEHYSCRVTHLGRTQRFEWEPDM